MGTRGRFTVLAVMLAVINISGLIWIHHDLTTQRGGKLRVMQALPAGSIDQADRLTLVFDEQLIGSNQIGRPASPPPFELSPRADGRWVWDAPDRLSFVFDQPPPPGHAYQVKPAAELATHFGREVVGEGQFAFQTRPLELNDAVVTATDRSHITFELRFNQPVDPDDLIDALLVKSRADGQLLDPTCLTRQPDQRMVFRVTRPRGDAIKLTIGPDLTGHGGNLPLGRPIHRQLRPEPLFSVLRTRVSQPSLDRPVTVSLQFSRTLDVAQALPSVKVEPEIEDLTISRSGSALRITGPFESGRRYSLTIPETLLDADQKPLGQAQTLQVQVPRYQPALRFIHDRGMLGLHGNHLLELRAVNVTNLRLEAQRVHANNIAQHVRGESAGATGRPITEKQLTLDLPPDQPQTVAVDLAELLGEPRGIYHITARGLDGRWVRDRAVVGVSDLAITAKRQHGGVWVWVTSISRGQAVTGAIVKALSYNNQTLSTGKTDEQGLVRLAVPENHPDGSPWLVTAELADDLACVRLDRQRPVDDRIDHRGRKPADTYDVMLYAERGVYRPGEAIHLTGIVRDRHGNTPDGLPLSVVVRRPDGKTVATLDTTAESTRQGLFHLKFTPADDCQMGGYRFTTTLRGGGDTLGQTTALVEAFVPVRMKVDAEPIHQRFVDNTPVELSVDAAYLFGQPAADLPVTATGRLSRTRYVSSRFADYVFDDVDGQTSRKLQPVEDKLDETGRAMIRCPMPDDLPAGLWRGSASVTVTEPGGRSVSDNLAFEVDTAGAHLGLYLGERQFVAVNTAHRVRWACVSPDDDPFTPESLHMRLERIEYETLIEQVNGRAVWKSHQRLIEVADRALTAEQINADHQGELVITCPEPAWYQLTLRTEADQPSPAAARIRFYAVADHQQPTNPTIASPEQVEVSLDRQHYQRGDVAQVLVRSPFVGNLMLTLETDQVITERLIVMEGKTCRIALPLDQPLRGGAFVTATVVRAVNATRDSWLPHRASGICRLTMQTERFTMPVDLQVSPRARPGQTVSVTLHTDRPTDPARPVMAHLWAVDEGVMLTSDYQTPDPLGHFHAARAMTIRTADTYSHLLPDHSRPASMQRIGGDRGEADLALRRSPVPLARRGAAVIWRKAMPVGPEGTLTVDLPMPKQTGQMRIMAVVVDADRYGKAQRHVTLNSPMLVEAGWPRFAAPGDRFDVPIKLFNNTDAPVAVKLGSVIDGPIEWADDGWPGAMTVPAHDNLTLWRTARTTGTGLISAHIVLRPANEDANLTAGHRAVFTVRPAWPLHSQTRLVQLEAGQNLRIDPDPAMLPETVRMHLSVSGRPDLQLLPAIEQLIDYPYGCVEQTTSRLYAMLYAPQLIKQASPEALRGRAIESLVDAGISRLWSMQTRNGGMSYWPGGTSANRWASTYVAQFMLRARDAGYAVDPAMLDNLIDYLEKQLIGMDDADVDANTRATLCYLLAAVDRPNLGWMARLAEQRDQLDIAGRAHLAAAWQAIGRHDAADATIAGDTLETAIESSAGGRITSQTRQYAVLLNALLDINPQHPWADLLARRLDEARGPDGYWASTLENATALAALSRYMTRRVDDQAFSGQVHLAGRQLGRFTHDQPLHLRSIKTPQPVEITTRGDGPVFIVQTLEGLVRPEAVEPYDRKMKVRRRWTDAQGQPVDPAKLAVGDLVMAEITIQTINPQAGSVANTAIVDALPGGMEVENPRLATSAAADQQPGDRADRVEFLDDRVIIFCTARQSLSRFRYPLRVITAGQFEVPPIQASCMYDPTWASLHRAQTLIKVTR